jgi:signal transduction histidine kinase
MTAPLLNLRLRNERDVVAARQRSREIAGLVGFDAQEQTRIATAVSEIARNAFRYAGGGQIEFSIDEALRIRVSDKGPGISDLDSILQGRYKSQTGMGLGIVGARRLMDAFHIDSRPGQGTSVLLSKILPRKIERLGAAELSRIADAIGRPSDDPYEELDLQSRELMRSLTDLRARQEELIQLNRELEETNRGVVALYAELDEKAEHLRQADRLKSTFLSHMSHEFRTPLNSIMALSKILIDRLDGPLSQEQEKQVTFIHNAARELTDMVNDLLDLAKVEAGKIEVHPSEFDVATLLGSLRGMMRPLCTSPNVQLVFDDAHCDLPPLYSDEGKLSQILRNLLANAIKFTEQGEIRLTCEYDKPSDFVVFNVSDTGLGIAPEDQEQIFQQYYQVDSPRQRKLKGTGLGLPLSRKLAELLGGSIRLRSEIGVGSTFSVKLPLRFPSTSGDPVLPGHPPPNATRQERIPRVLLIDDEDVARYLIRKLLSDLPIEIQESRSGADGIRFAREHAVDLIILDLAMPETSGYEVMAALGNEPETRDIPVVVHTSLSLGNAERKALSHAKAIVSKSRSGPDLRNIVDAIIASTR